MKSYLKDDLDKNNPEFISAIDELSIWSAPFGMKMLEIIEMKPDMKILDIGFGTGFPLLEVVQRLGSSCQATGIDPWIMAYERTKFKIDQYKLKNVELIIGTAENMPFPNDSFHLIISNNGINNVNDEPAVYRESYRVCKPGSQFVFTFNLPESFIEFYKIFEEVLKENGKTEEIKKMRDHIHRKRKTIEETKNLVKQAGFKVSKVITDKFFWRYTNGTSMLNHYFIRIAFLSSWKEILKPEDHEFIFDIVEKRLNQKAEVDGEFFMTIPFAVFNCRKDM